LLFARLVGEVRSKLFDSTVPVVNAFGTKVIVSDVLMIHMDTHLSTFEKRRAFLESLNREVLF
jgi:hypothetical protein